jgi:RDD family protein
MEQENPDLLQEFEHTIDLTPVKPGLRFVNYLIDLIAFYAVSFVVGLLMAAGIAVAANDPDNYNGVSDNSGGYMQLVLLFGWLLIIFGYYTLFCHRRRILHKS